ncbi:MAG TPA: hypothetical protein VJN63_09135 [Thermoplasmata archaeon]|nr:hypothetical protein [Thermoplasmata archaeon]
MRLFVSPQELLDLDGFLQRAITEDQVPPGILVIAGKVKSLIRELAEAIPDEPLSP